MGLRGYELVKKLGQGGMGAVWLAYETKTRWTCAIKTLKDEQSGSQQAAYATPPLKQLDRFERLRVMMLDEAQLARQIVHRNVATMLDIGEDDETKAPFLVMEWVDGCALRDLLPDFRSAPSSAHSLPLGIALRIVADACCGLHAAHELRGPDGELRDLVHRDVSPHNILVSREGVAKLIDFGIAKARERLAGETSTGIIKGKARYMAPEQALSRKVDRRTDIFAMGAVLFHAVVGLPPFTGDNDVAILKQLLDVSGVELPPSVPTQLRPVLLRAMHPKPGLRYRTALEFARAIEDAMTALELPTSEHDVAAFIARRLPPPRPRLLAEVTHSDRSVPSPSSDKSHADETDVDSTQHEHTHFTHVRTPSVTRRARSKEGWLPLCLGAFVVATGLIVSTVVVKTRATTTAHHHHHVVTTPDVAEPTRAKVVVAPAASPSPTPSPSPSPSPTPTPTQSPSPPPSPPEIEEPTKPVVKVPNKRAQAPVKPAKATTPAAAAAAAAAMDSDLQTSLRDRR